MLIKHPSDCLPSEITPRTLFERRRDFLRLSTGAALGAMLPHAYAATRLTAAPSAFSTTETLTPYKDVTTYNNFYEFGTDKSEPAKDSGDFRTRPWTVSIEGLVKKPVKLGIDDILKLAPLEERIYRLRCVEGWSMVIPWVGFSLSTLLKQVEPLGNAKYAQFITALQRDTMSGTGGLFASLDWPYSEGLRMDEAMHPLAMIAVGLYGEVLPNQNGAPVRIVVPWKYGFKSAKSIVTIRLTERQPPTSWNKSAPKEYGFYSNVNPEVDHPRWSQATERRIGEFFKRKTLMFNGYGNQVASLYTGMDLRRYF